MKPIFVTGIGTGVGKTVASAIVTEALEAQYWKPIQAGFDEGTDAQTISHLISNRNTVIHKEVYKLQLPASPHIAAREENIVINLDAIGEAFQQLPQSTSEYLVIEGAGGLLVPVNEHQFIIDIIKKLKAKVILVSRNYLGSINHSLLTAAVCKSHQLDVIGWLFNDQYLHYEEEIVNWSGYPKIASLPVSERVDKHFVKREAEGLKNALLKYL